MAPSAAPARTQPDRIRTPSAASAPAQASRARASRAPRAGVRAAAPPAADAPSVPCLAPAAAVEDIHALPDAGTRRLLRYLPLALLTTALVTVVPAIAAKAALQANDIVSTATSVALAVVLSLVIATAEAAAWKRWRSSREIVFADLMLWGWARRVFYERRLAHAQRLLREAHRAGSAAGIETLTHLSRLLEARDAYTHGHSERVMRHAARIARAMSLAPEEVAKVRVAAAVHDVGKLNTPRSVLTNPERLTDAEYEVMKRHAGDGAEMLAEMRAPEIAAMVRHHHERIDGSGYPEGLTGSQIPLGARIIAVADTFDALTSARPYRPASSQKRALKILRDGAGKQLDETAVAAFLGHYSSRRSIAGFAFVAALPQLMLVALQSTSSGLALGVGGLGALVPALGTAGGFALSQPSQAAGEYAPAPAPITTLAAPAMPLGPAITLLRSTTPSGAGARAQARDGAVGRHSRSRAGSTPRAAQPRSPTNTRVAARTHTAAGGATTSTLVPTPASGTNEMPQKPPASEEQPAPTTTTPSPAPVELPTVTVKLPAPLPVSVPGEAPVTVKVP
jgi:putative nucleotidyltransferase with HDIG domain